MTDHRIAAVSDVPRQGIGSLTIEVNGTPIGLYRLGEEIVAWRNVCPHAAAQVCRGNVEGTRLESDVYEYVYGRDQEILQCPWHGWEFDLRTGEHLASGSSARLRRYPVEVRDGNVFDASAAAQRTSLDVVVAERVREAPAVLRFVLARADGGQFPAWTPGTHLEVELPSGLTRQYSLCGDPHDRSVLEIAVLRESDGRGGSIEMHDDVSVGAALRIVAIRNRFSLKPRPSYTLIAGGIGVTPLLPMARSLVRRGVPVTIFYLGRIRSTMAFANEIAAIPGARLVESAREGRADLAGIVEAAADGSAIYACGPDSMINELKLVGSAHGSHVELVTESFGVQRAGQAGSELPDANRAFTVELARAGTEHRVPADDSILNVLRRAGYPAGSSCEQGWCGSCEMAVVDGEIEHRDTVLSDEEREEGTSMMVCVSRARSERLVLDL